MEVCKDFYKILENNLWNRQHPEVHTYLIELLNACGSATWKEELEKRFKNCIELRVSSGIENTEDMM